MALDRPGQKNRAFIAPGSSPFREWHCKSKRFWGYPHYRCSPRQGLSLIPSLNIALCSPKNWAVIAFLFGLDSAA